MELRSEANERTDATLEPDLALMARGLLTGVDGLGSGRVRVGCAAGAWLAAAAAAILCGEPTWAGMEAWLLAEDLAEEPRRKIGCRCSSDAAGRARLASS